MNTDLPPEWTGLHVAPLVARLRHYNAWRRGAETAQPDPATIGADLDAALTQLEAMARAIHITLDYHPDLADGDQCTLLALVQVARGDATHAQPMIHRETT